MVESKALIGRRRIISYLQISKRCFYDLLNDGLPVIKRGGRLSANTAELDDWFRVDQDRKAKNQKPGSASR